MSKLKISPQEQEALDIKMEKFWESLEDVPFIENENKELVLDGEFLFFEKGTPVEVIWSFFDKNHSKGVAYLMNEYNIDFEESEEEM